MVSGGQGGAGGLHPFPTPTAGPFAAREVINLGQVPDAWEVAASIFEPPPPYSTDVPLWAQDKLEEYLWGMQQEIANSVVTERYTAVQSCHDAGKSFIASRIAAWWIDTHPIGEAFVVSTAPTNAQVAAVLWREIGKAHTKGKMPGKIISAGYPQWKVAVGATSELVGYGRKPADYSDSAFQGIHAKYVLVIIDEAGGIDKSLFDAADALATNKGARVLAIGNPDDPTAHFAEICKPDSGWNVLRIDGLRTPNFTQEFVEWMDCRQCRKAGQTRNLLTRLMQEEGIPYSQEPIPEYLRDYLLTPEWVEERLHRWVGRVEPGKSVAEMAAQSSLFTAKVRGLFPNSNSEGVIPLGWVERAMARGRDRADAGLIPDGRKVVGADIADSGADESALAIRKGNSIISIRKFPHADTMETTGHIKAALNEPDAHAVVDVIGVGAGVVSRLREMQVSVRAFNAAKSAEDRKDATGEFGFTNLRAWAWWHLRELLDPSRGSDITLPDDEMLKADLTAPKWRVLSGGKIQIESKDEIRKRLGRSTDSGDAVLMAFTTDSYVPGATRDVVDWWDRTPGAVKRQDREADDFHFDGEVELENWLRDADRLGDPTTWQ